MRTHTNANAALRQMWFCERCGAKHEGDDPPDRCTHCAHTYFENGLDIVGRGRRLPSPRPVDDAELR